MDKIRLVLDLGHGGNDPGAINPGFKLKESDVNLNIGLILKAIFDTHPEYAVWMTRTEDVPLSLSARTDLANRNQAKIVSIHCNAVSDLTVHGTEVWCFSKEDKAGNISEGYHLASSILEELTPLVLKNRGVKTIYDWKTKQYTARPLWILRKSINTAVLVECGFVSNQEEASKLDIDLDGFNERLAVAIFKGIDKILNPKGGELA